MRTALEAITEKVFKDKYYYDQLCVVYKNLHEVITLRGPGMYTHRFERLDAGNLISFILSNILGFVVIEKREIDNPSGVFSDNKSVEITFNVNEAKLMHPQQSLMYISQEYIDMLPPIDPIDWDKISKIPNF